MSHPTYIKNLARHSDIREHLGLLRGLALECDVVVELGFRTGVSTSAFLAAERPKVFSFDLLPSGMMVNSFNSRYPKQFEFAIGDSRKIMIPRCDLLFIDTDHTYLTTLTELELHHDRVDKWIVLHDTTTFGDVDRGSKVRVKPQGIYTAIETFLLSAAADQEWEIQLRLTNNNGLTILKRVGGL